MNSVTSPKKVPFLLGKRCWFRWCQKLSPEMVGKMVIRLPTSKFGEISISSFNYPPWKKPKTHPLKNRLWDKGLPSFLDPFALFSRDNDNIHQPQTLYQTFLESAFPDIMKPPVSSEVGRCVGRQKKRLDPFFEQSQKNFHHFFVGKKIGKQLFINLRNLQRTNTPSWHPSKRSGGPRYR